MNTKEQACEEKEGLKGDAAVPDDREAVTEKEIAGLIYEAQYRC